MADLFVRGLEDDIKTRLAQQARENGVSLTKYVCNILTDYALRPELKSTEDRYTALVKNMAALYQSLQHQTNQLLSENINALHRTSELLEVADRREKPAW